MTSPWPKYKEHEIELVSRIQTKMQKLFFVWNLVVIASSKVLTHDESIHRHNENQHSKSI